MGANTVIKIIIYTVLTVKNSTPELIWLLDKISYHLHKECLVHMMRPQETKTTMHLKRHVIWQIGDGRSTKFWLDKWVSSNTSLFSSANQSYVDTTASVRDALNTAGDWDQKILMDNLSVDIINQILVLPTPSNFDGPDTVGWGGTSTLQFNVQSAYNTGNSKVY